MERNRLEAVTFERTRDYELVRQIITHRKLYPWVSYDFSPKPEDFQPVQSEVVWYILAKHSDGTLLGCWILAPQNAVCWEVHTCLLPVAWGSRAQQAARGCIQWVWANSPCLRLVTNVPMYNRLALRFAEAAGLVRFGV